MREKKKLSEIELKLKEKEKKTLGDTLSMFWYKQSVPVLTLWSPIPQPLRSLFALPPPPRLAAQVQLKCQQSSVPFNQLAQLKIRKKDRRKQSKKKIYGICIYFYLDKYS